MQSDATSKNDPYYSLLGEIQILGDSLTRKTLHLNKLIPRVHSGRAYNDAMGRFKYEINRLEDRYGVFVKSFAVSIANLALKKTKQHWTKDKDIMVLWQKLAAIVENFSEHPTKKNAAFIINEVTGEMEAFSANRTPPGLKTKPSHHRPGIRKDFIVCAERLVIADFFKISVRSYKGLPAAYRVQNLSRDLTLLGHHTKELEGSYLYSPVIPCKLCSDVIVPYGFRGVISDPNGGKHFNAARRESFEVTLRALKTHKIQFLDFSRLMASPS